MPAHPKIDTKRTFDRPLPGKVDPGPRHADGWPHLRWDSGEIEAACEEATPCRRTLEPRLTLHPPAEGASFETGPGKTGVGLRLQVHGHIVELPNLPRCRAARVERHLETVDRTLQPPAEAQRARELRNAECPASVVQIDLRIEIDLQGELAALRQGPARGESRLSHLGLEGLKSDVEVSRDGETGARRTHLDSLVSPPNATRHVHEEAPAPDGTLGRDPLEHELPRRRVSPEHGCATNRHHLDLDRRGGTRLVQRVVLGAR
jgi:hypothetical protein